MLFNSIDFAIFLPIVFILYWFVLKNKRDQNILLLIASYYFYGCWDWRFLGLILISTIVDYFVGLSIYNETDNKKRKYWLYASIFVNIGFLAFFKYFNFFIESFIDAFSVLGIKAEHSTLKIILPVGISFYTFQTLSYSIDIYKKKLQPSEDIISFAAFVSFFPQLVAGPIERATNLLPQFNTERYFNLKKAEDGMRQILWGLFKKIVIADSCATIANLTFSNTDSYSGVVLFIGAVFFALQIYGDFSGYSDIAIGTARLFGFNLMQNFAFPYFSRDIAEFWRRWHISLSTWFRDYIYIPLGGSRGSKGMIIRNTLIIFIVSGFWHGDNWKFIAWGTLHALFFLPLILTGNNRRNVAFSKNSSFITSITDTFKIITTFVLVTIAWVFFRATNIEHAVSYISRIFSFGQTDQLHQFYEREIGLGLVIIILTFLLIEWIGRHNQYAIERWNNIYIKPIRWSLYVVIFSTIIFIQGAEQQFIYFQF